MEDWKFIVISIAAIIFVAVVLGVSIYCCCCRKKQTAGKETGKKIKYAHLGDIEDGFLASSRKYDQNDRDNVYIQSEKDTELDLHYLSVKQAVDAVQDLLDTTQTRNEYSKQRNKTKHVDVITGRGIHSPSGFPAIKNAVRNYLTKNGYRYQLRNAGGMVRIFLD